MNRRMIAFILGRVLLVEAALMLPSVLVGLIYGERAVVSFIAPILLLALTGLLFSLRRPDDTVIYARDGFFAVAMAWVLMSLFGALPLYLSGCFSSVWDCIFEIVSGFTTTGASICADVEALPRCIAFWRSFTHWVGGMGVLVFVLAVIPLADNRSLHLMRAEVPGPSVGKLVPRARKTALILYAVYSGMTLVLIGLLLLGGMPLFDSFCHAFGTAGTGGFSVRNAGIAYYNSAYIDIVLSIFMLLFGMNFNLFYLILIGRLRDAFSSEELRCYLIIVGVSVAAIALNISPIYLDTGRTLRDALFQVSSIITTTGFATADFGHDWPQFSQHLLLMLMVIGACAGSTGGGLKVSRVIVLAKTVREEISHILHPRQVTSIRLDGRALEKETIMGVRAYFVVYIIIICLSILLLSLDGNDFTTNLSAELACFNNIGPGLSLVGPDSNYAFFSPFCKMLLSLNMLLGRLEIFPLLVLFSARSWKRA